MNLHFLWQELTLRFELFKGKIFTSSICSFIYNSQKYVIDSILLSSQWGGNLFHAHLLFWDIIHYHSQSWAAITKNYWVKWCDHLFSSKTIEEANFIFLNTQIKSDESTYIFSPLNFKAIKQLNIYHIHTEALKLLILLKLSFEAMKWTISFLKLLPCRVLLC
jgi:hypothetical protein